MTHSVHPQCKCDKFQSQTNRPDLYQCFFGFHHQRSKTRHIQPHQQESPVFLLVYRSSKKCIFKNNYCVNLGIKPFLLFCFELINILIKVLFSDLTHYKKDDMLFQFGFYFSSLLITFSQNIIYTFLLALNGFQTEKKSNYWQRFFIFLCSLFVAP